MPANSLDRPGARLGRVVNLERTVNQFGPDKVAVFLESLLSADQLADAALEQMSSLAREERSGLLNRAIAEGISATPGAPPALVALFEQLDAVPPWVDWDQLHRGAVAYWKAGWVTPFVLLSSTLPRSFLYPAVARVAMFTGRFTNEDAFRRTKETSRWFLAATRPGGLRRDAPGFAHTVQVRVVHAAVRRALVRHPDWDHDRWGTPICHADTQYGVTYGFGTAVLDAYKQLGFPVSVQEVDDMRAMLRYLGYLLGLPEHLNPATEPEARELRRLYESLSDGPEDAGKHLIHSLLEVSCARNAGYDGMPRPVRVLFSPERLLTVMHGLSHFFLGRENAAALDIPSSRWRHLPVATRPVVMAKERLRAVVGPDDEELGRRARAALEKSLADVLSVADPDDIDRDVTKNRSRVAQLMAAGAFNPRRTKR